MRKSKTIFWAILAVFMMTGVAMGAFVDQGGNTVCTSGNVGIGTSTPGDYLSWQNPAFHVNGIRPTVNLTTTQTGGYTTIRMQGPSPNSQLHLNFIDGSPWQFKFYSYQTGTDIIKILGNGNVGIGTTSPDAKLDISDGTDHIKLSPGNITSTRGSNGLWISSASDIKFITNTIGNGSFADVGFYFQSETNPRIYFRTNGDCYFNTGGNVGIGEKNPQYKLAVNGTIKTREVIVTNNGWSDYVFNRNYKLKPLPEVERYIRQNGHLPGIPSKNEVKKQGVSVGEMQAKLLAKVEELTLHLIEQNKKLAALEAENAELKEAIAKIATAKR